MNLADLRPHQLVGIMKRFYPFLLPFSNIQADLSPPSIRALAGCGAARQIFRATHIYFRLLLPQFRTTWRPPPWPSWRFAFLFASSRFNLFSVNCPQNRRSISWYLGGSIDPPSALGTPRMPDAHRNKTSGRHTHNRTPQSAPPESDSLASP